MSSKTALLEQQRMWATSVGADIDTRGYLSSVAENLYLEALSTGRSNPMLVCFTNAVGQLRNLVGEEE